VESGVTQVMLQSSVDVFFCFCVSCDIVGDFKFPLKPKV